MDKDKVVRLFQTQRGPLAGVARRVLGPASTEIEDAVQDSFVRLLEYEGRPLDCPEGFLFVSAGQVAIDLVRRRNVRSRVEVQGIPAMQEDGPIDIPDDQTPERTHEDRERCDVVNRALAELPARCRLAFILVAIDGLDNAEAARQLGVAEGSIRRYLTQAEKHYKAALQRYETGRVRK